MSAYVDEWNKGPKRWRYSLGTARVTSSSCEVRLRYARQSSVPKVTTGAIPILTPLKYKLYDGTGYVQIAEANSLNAGPE